MNTLLTSLHERTREIGLLRAMGLSSRAVFSVFSFRALVIGAFGGLIGIGSAVGAGLAGNIVLGDGLLAGLPGLTLMVFTPANLVTAIGLVLLIALLAGTGPALIAASKDPITALRYE